jgi:hypothetical protein
MRLKLETLQTMNMFDIEAIGQEMYTAHMGPMDKSYAIANSIIIKQDRILFLKYIIEHFETRFNIDFMLWNLRFWDDFKIDDWCYLMANVVNRPAFDYRLLDTGYYDDLRFLNIYIGVNSYELFFSNSKINQREKASTKDFMKKFTFFFTDNEKYLDGIQETLPYDFVEFAAEYKKNNIGMQYTRPIHDPSDLLNFLKRTSCRCCPPRHQQTTKQNTNTQNT